jgi:hypothetical protein
MKQGLDREVAVIPVPAGFGNSGPAPSSLAKTDRHATSLSLNWGDNDPVWFQT